MMSLNLNAPKIEVNINDTNNPSKKQTVRLDWKGNLSYYMVSTETKFKYTDSDRLK